MKDMHSPLGTLQQAVQQFAEDEGVTLAQAFGHHGISLLEEAGELGGPETFHSPVGRISALDWDDEVKRLTAVVVDHRPSQDGDEREYKALSLIAGEASQQLARNIRARATGHGEPGEAGRLLRYVAEVLDRISSVRVVVITNGASARTNGELEHVGEHPADLVIRDIADLVSLSQYSTSRDQEVRFDRVPGGGLRALGPIGAHGLPGYLLVIPGDVIADLYHARGAGVLGRNVRAFLQVQNRVNKGIRTTAKELPASFFAFNNGLSLTATEVERALTATGPVVTALKGLEIVNGGQTTASLHHAKYHDGADLSQVFVQAKLTVLPREDADEIALSIARNANSQSPVRMGDLTANSRFFTSLESLARTITFGTSGLEPRHWYFERLRGQYATERSAARAAGAETRFTSRFNPRRKFDKSELAKFELAWFQFPHVVAAGAERALAHFMNLENGPAAGGVPDETYFRRLVAKAILWHAADGVLKELDLGGYKATDVAYTISLIVHRLGGRVNLEHIADEQDAGTTWRAAVAEAAPLVHENLIRSAGVRNVSTWAKTTAAWDEVKRIDWSAPDELSYGVRADDPSRRAVAKTQIDLSLAADENEIEGRDRVVDYGSEAWFQLAQWAKQTEHLQSWQRGLAFSIGRVVAGGRQPSAKQVVQALKILDEADRLGFEPRRS